MHAYSYDNDGKYIGIYNCQIDPIAMRREGHDVYLLPASATFAAPPEYDPETEIPVWDGEQWELELLPEPESEPEPEPEPTETDLLKQQIADLQNQILTMRLGG